MAHPSVFDIKKAVFLSNRKKNGFFYSIKYKKFLNYGAVPPIDDTIPNLAPVAEKIY